MTDPDTAIGERLAAVETDIRHILNDTARIAHIESSVARIENVFDRQQKERFDAGLARIANIINKETTAVYVTCGAVIVWIVAMLF
ncbi:MAG: hypothetical protein F4X98_12575 [Gammaproteobacteria bacterium]|nr:hypothetical protein [Gammaproteobacteria bacterium]